MSGRLREIARQTVEIVEVGRYSSPAGETVEIGSAVAAAVAGTRYYSPEHELPPAPEPPAPEPPAPEPPAPEPPAPEPPALGVRASAVPASGVRAAAVRAGPTVEVTRESTLAAARRLGPGTVALNFASARNPGGGFLGGAKAQEESLARASALYPCLLAAPAFYEYHRANRDARYSHRVVYTPEVPVFRDDDGNLLDRPYRTSFLTAAAPNLGAIRRNQPEHVSEVPGLLLRRAVRVLRIAAAHGHRRLVLGAWGCGVFRNDPATVAGAFAAALAKVDGFEQVTFAIYDSLPGTPVHAAFATTFPSPPPPPPSPR